VIKVHIDLDVEGYRPERGDTDREGNEIEDRIYNTKDFDRTLVIDDRTKLVAKKVSDFLKESHDRFQKTIVFCVDEEHAARMRQALVNENKDLCNENYRYVMRITGSDTEGQAQLGNFIDPEAKYPVLVTTSRLPSTGVDAQTCRLIVLDRPVGSMTEFKQIVGRGTRVHEDIKKFYFTLIDFRGATNHFADPDFDGEPVQIYEPGQNDPMTPPDDASTAGGDESIPPTPGDDEVIVDQPPDISISTEPERQRKIYVDGVGATIVAERVEYLDEKGKLVTETLRDFTKKALKPLRPKRAALQAAQASAPDALLPDKSQIFSILNWSTFTPPQWSGFTPPLTPSPARLRRPGVCHARRIAAGSAQSSAQAREARRKKARPAERDVAPA
jgi:type I restriction enzyme, R subunit